jgi:hypothetical protein
LVRRNSIVALIEVFQACEASFQQFFRLPVFAGGSFPPFEKGGKGAPIPLLHGAYLLATLPVMAGDAA